jgi:tetratricopeptide (TPR) repeat protein
VISDKKISLSTKWWGMRNFLIFISVFLKLSQAIADSKSVADAYQKAALEKLNSENYSGAIEDYTKGIALDPGNEGLLMGRALAKSLSKDSTGALKDSEIVIKLNPKNSLAYYLRGEVKESLNMSKSAIADFNEAIRLKTLDHSNLILAYKGRARAKVAMKDHLGAIRDYSEVLKLNPTDPMSYYMRGQMKLLSGDKSGALADLSKAGELGYLDAYDTIKLIQGSK